MGGEIAVDGLLDRDRLTACDRGRIPAPKRSDLVDPVV
jgi:hypothetical protein